MKIILKTMLSELTIKYDEKFISEMNTNILHQLISRIISSMKPRFNPSYKQINNWLSALHIHETEIKMAEMVKMVKMVKIISIWTLPKVKIAEITSY
jgi:hypothetical protein